MFNILILEDDKALNRSFCSFLHQNGYNTVGCLNAEEAYIAMYENVFDIIISDIMMPVLDGYSLVRQLREAGSTTPVLMITAKDSFQDMQTGFGVGSDDYMVKPIDLDEMFLRIGALLRRAGVTRIEISCDCTACRPDRFWSHRRVGNDRGSLAAIIVREGERNE